jgi:hypothetical protein
MTHKNCPGGNCPVSLAAPVSPREEIMDNSEDLRFVTFAVIFAIMASWETAGHEGMTIGLVQFQGSERQTLPWMLLLPFRGKEGEGA